MFLRKKNRWKTIQNILGFAEAWFVILFIIYSLIKGCLLDPKEDFFENPFLGGMCVMLWLVCIVHSIVDSGVISEQNSGRNFDDDLHAGFVDCLKNLTIIDKCPCGSGKLAYGCDCKLADLRKKYDKSERDYDNNKKELYSEFDDYLLGKKLDEKCLCGSGKNYVDCKCRTAELRRLLPFVRK